MKFVIQRVTGASVSVEGETVGAIRNGFLVLIGVTDTDTEAVADKMLRKMLNLAFLKMKTEKPIWRSKT